MTNDWADEKANEIMAKWYGTDPDEPGEGPTNAMLLSYFSKALREVKRETLEKAAKVCDDGFARYTVEPGCKECGLNHQHLGARIMDLYSLGCRDTHSSNALAIRALKEGVK